MSASATGVSLFWQAKSTIAITAYLPLVLSFKAFLLSHILI
jgi:hypothetical protein